MVDITYQCRDCELEFHGDCRDPHCGCCRGVTPVVDDLRDGLYPDEDDYRDAA